MTESSYTHTARGQRSATTALEPWEAGSYTLLADRWTDADHVEHVRGDGIELDAERATLLGNTGSIAAPDSPAAEAARATPGTRSTDVRTDSPTTREGGSGA